MAVYRRRTWIDAPLSSVWELYSTVSGLRYVTPDWMHLRIESVTGPDGDPNPGVLEAGSRIRLSIRPFGVGPRQRWVSRIDAREEGDDAAYFRDVMEEGPFPTWSHTHRFEAERGGTRMTDRVEYELPWPFRRVSAFGWPFFEPMFAYRHRRTRKRFA